MEGWRDKGRQVAGEKLPFVATSEPTHVFVSELFLLLLFFQLLSGSAIFQRGEVY